MRQGWLVYDEVDIEKNKASISMFTEYAKKVGIRLELITSQYLEGEICKGLSAVESLKDAIVINRSRSYELAKEFEKITPYVFNSSTVTLYGNDKYKAVCFLKEKGIPIIPTYSVDEITESIAESKPINYPLVGKTRNGHGGAEVFLVSADEEVVQLKDKYGQNILFQDYVKTGNSDMRVYVVGNEILCAMLRSSDKDFRSNFSLGGEAKFVDAPTEVIEQTKKIVEALGGAAYCGIDFLRNEDGWIFNEIEDVVGARMVYSNTEYDPILEFVKYIKEIMK